MICSLVGADETEGVVEVVAAPGDIMRTPEAAGNEG